MSTLRMRTAVVTGASSGIGRAIALGLAQAGATVLLVGRDAARLEEAVQAIGEAAPQASWLRTDLSQASEAHALGPRILRTLPEVDILVHAAGVIALGSVESADPTELDRQYHVHVRAPLVLTQALLPSLRARQGELVIVNSTAVLQATPGAAAYAATKQAAATFANALREEVNRDGVRVLSLLLGRTATPMQEAVHAAEGRSYRPELLIQPEDVASVVVQALSLPRTAEIMEIRMRPTLRSY